jgi:hypothetical protein
MNCGIINFASAEACRRCQSAASSGEAANPYTQANYQQPGPQSHFAPQANYQTGDRSQPLPQPPANPYGQPSYYPQNGYANNPSQPLNQSPVNPYNQGGLVQGNLPPVGGEFTQNGGYGQNQNFGQLQNPAPHSYGANPYAQNTGYQQNSGYAYNRGNTNGLNPQGQANHSQPSYAHTDYAQAPSYGGPAMAAYPPMSYGGQAAGVWRDGKKLVMHKQAFLPDRCVKCNAPTNGAYLHRKLSWLHPACKIAILFGLIGWIIYAILSASMKKKAEVDFGLCEQHTNSRKTHMTMGWAMVIFGGFLFFLAFSTESGAMILLGIVLLIAGAIVASLAYGVVTVTKMDDQYVWMSRVNQDYLANFPSSNGF